MRNLIKSIVKGSLVEPVCRSVDQKMRQMLCQFKKMIGTADINDRYDAETFRVMKRQLRRDSNCIDIGCHHGEMLKEMLKHSPEGHHFAFEPLPGLFAGLTETFAGFPNVQPFHCALSARDGETTFRHVVSIPAYSGILKRS